MPKINLGSTGNIQNIIKAQFEDSRVYGNFGKGQNVRE